jgi:ubiquinone/menaquinone biosynthesis C-methylase UbiE
MLAIAEERARSLRLHDIMDFKQNDAKNLELGTNQEFDAILCRWGLMFLPNLDKALSNIMHLLISRGCWQLLFGPNHLKSHSSICL